MRKFKYICLLVMFCTLIAGLILFFTSIQYDKLQLLGVILIIVGSCFCAGIFIGDMGHE